MSLRSSTCSKHSQLLSINSSVRQRLDCFNFKPGCSVFTVYTVAVLLLVLPLCILVLYRGLERWWKHDQTTHRSNSFTYHIVIMELMSVFGISLYCASIYLSPFPLLELWISLASFNWLGEALFHIVTCLELYLAAVHPIAYLRLRKQRWVMARRVVIGWIWLTCIIGTVLMNSGKIYFVAELCFLVLCLIVICFCSLSVLWVLIRPGPAARGGDRMRVGHSKVRAFFTILVILGVLLLRITWNLVWTAMSLLGMEIDDCVEMMCEIWINIPGSLLLPLLFLQKTGTLICWKSNK